MTTKTVYLDASGVVVACAWEHEGHTTADLETVQGILPAVVARIEGAPADVEKKDNGRRPYHHRKTGGDGTAIEDYVQVVPGEPELPPLAEYQAIKIAEMARALCTYMEGAFFLDRKIGLLGLFGLCLLDDSLAQRKGHIRDALVWGCVTVPTHYGERKAAVLAAGNHADVDAAVALFDLSQFDASRPDVTMMTALAVPN